MEYHDATKPLGLAHFDEIAEDSRQKVQELSPTIAVSTVLRLSLYHFASKDYQSRLRGSSTSLSKWEICTSDGGWFRDAEGGLFLDDARLEQKWQLSGEVKA